MAAENIFAQFAQPVRSVADYMGDMDARDLRRQQLVGAQRQNALSALVAQQQQQTMQDGAADRNALQSLAGGWNAQTTPDQRIAALRNSGRAGLMTQADALEKQSIERTKGDSEAKAKQAEVLGKVLSAQGELATRVMANPTRESAAAAVANMKALTAALGVQMDFSGDEAAIGQFQSPDQIKQWAAGHALKASELLPKLQVLNTGNAQVNQAIDPLTGKPTNTGTMAINQSPDSIATNETQRRGQNITAGTAAAQLRQADAHFKAQQDGPTWDATNQVFVDKNKRTVTPGVLPDGQPMPGKTPPIEYQKQATAFQNMDDALTNYKTVLADFGKTDMLNPSKRAAMGQAYQNALLQAKEIYQLGVLNGGDERILKGIINSPLDFTSAMIPTDALQKQATDLQGILVRNNENMAKVHRQKPIPLKSTFGDQAAGAPSGATKIGSDAEYNALPSGATFVGPDGKTRRKP